MRLFPLVPRLLAGAFLAVAALPARAGDGAPKITGVVELFTSQGCNSCPPADAVLEELGRRPDLVALGYHIDYWDYLGWRDTLGRRENTARQRLYMHALKSRSVYTPQAVVNGRIHMNGSNREGLLRALKEMSLAGAGVVVPLAVSERDGAVAIEVGAVTDAQCPHIRQAGLLLVSFMAPQRVAIETGENQGHALTYWNPVTAVRPLGLWRREAARFTVPPEALGNAEGSVALLQTVEANGLPGAILGAAVVRRPRRR